VVCRMKRADVIDNSRIQAGDVVIGLASFGKASYENEYNGGMGSNGLTSARHDVFGKSYATKYPESFDAGISADLVYTGKYKVNDAAEGTPVDIGKLVLSPTRTYAPVIVPVLRQFRQHIRGIVHCSGGAQTKVLHFIEKLHVVKDNLFPIPPLFRIIHEQSQTSWKEMYKVFNMGHRMEIYTSPQFASSIIDIAKELGVDAQIIGRVEPAEQKQVTVNSEYGTFIYN